ncbi:MAG: hypothetical protein ACOVOQ_04925 [Flavobacterium sp.]
MKEIVIEYKNFFKEFEINTTTGILKNFPNIKFITMPFIGSKFEVSKTKILFVGMDVGKDETPNRYQDLAERNSNIENNTGFNPHIAGTYASALFLLKEENEWKDIWEKFISYPTYSQATKFQNHKNEENPLSFISLTNIHKFVTINRQNRSGDENRKFLKREIEESLLLKEIAILKPNIILFQGKLPSNSIVERIKEEKIRIILAYHPAYRKKGGRNPKIYTETFREI